MKAIVRKKEGPGRGWWGPPKGDHTADRVPGGEGGGGGPEAKIKELEKQGYKIAYGSKEELLQAQWESFKNSDMMQRELEIKKARMSNELRDAVSRDTIKKWSNEGVGLEEIRRRITQARDEKFESLKPGLIEKSRKEFFANWDKKYPDSVVIKDPDELNAIVTGLQKAQKSGSVGSDVLYVLRNPIDDHEQWVTGHYNGTIVMHNTGNVSVGILNREGEHISKSDFFRHRSIDENRVHATSLYKNYYEGVFTHEYGHHLAARDPRIEQRAGNIYGRYSKTKLSTLISEYAAERQIEVASESYALKRHPDFERLPAETKQAVNYIWEGVGE